MIRFIVAGLLLLIGIGGLHIMGKMTGPMKDSNLPMQMMDVGMILTGIAILIRRPLETGPYAGARKRIWATLIDALIAVLIGLPLNHLGMSLGRPLYLALSGVFYFTFSFMSICGHARYGMTHGKYFMSIRVVDTRFTTIGWRQAFLRSSVDLLLASLLFINFVLFIYGMEFDDFKALSWSRRQGEISLHTSTFFLVISGLQNLWGMSEIAVMMLNGKRRALHDFIAGTVTVNGRKATDAG